MTEPNRQSGENEERIIEIEIERLRPFKEHPFQVKDDIISVDEKRFDSDNRSEDYQAYENLVKETICDRPGSEDDSIDLCSCQRNPWIYIHFVDYSDCILLP